ncbi:MAG: hypothetical protein JSW16_04765, partial [Dehalococcoidales bacterium]
MIIGILLIALLLFLELTQTVATGKRTAILGRYRVGLGNISNILFVIVLGMIFTRVVMVLTT